MNLRPASLEDSVQLCQVVRTSIEQLCSLDHRDDPAILEDWLANKTPENVALWLSNADARLCVAEVDHVIVGAGCSMRDGEIVLNYVSPIAQYKGVSSAMLRYMEAQVCQDGNGEVRLGSTATAHQFYRERGYVDVGAPRQKFGLPTLPMKKDGIGSSRQRGLLT